MRVLEMLTRLLRLHTDRIPSLPGPPEHNPEYHHAVNRLQVMQSEVERRQIQRARTAGEVLRDAWRERGE